MPNLNLDCGYFDHPKTRRLIGLLGRGAEVLPLKLWSYCGMYHAESGRLIGYGAQEIESIIGWWGKPGDAIAALLKVHPTHGPWITQDEDGFTVCGWTEWQGHIHAMKLRGKKAAKARWGEIKDATGNATSIAPGIARSPPMQCSILLPIPTNPPSASGGGRGEKWNPRPKPDGVDL